MWLPAPGMLRSSERSGDNLIRWNAPYQLSPGHRGWVDSPRCLWNKRRAGAGATHLSEPGSSTPGSFGTETHTVSGGPVSSRPARCIDVTPLFSWVCLLFQEVPAQKDRFLGLPISSWKTVGFSTENIVDNLHPEPLSGPASEALAAVSNNPNGEAGALTRTSSRLLHMKTHLNQTSESQGTSQLWPPPSDSSSHSNPGPASLAPTIKKTTWSAYQQIIWVIFLRSWNLITARKEEKRRVLCAIQWVLVSYFMHSSVWGKNFLKTWTCITDSLCSTPETNTTL